MGMSDTWNAVRIPAILLFLLSLASCALSGVTGFKSGEPKNSIPFIEKERIALIRSIAVLPFYQDDAGWHKASFDVLSSSSRLSLIQPREYDMFIKGSNKNLIRLAPEDRLPAVSAIGKALDADAVLNGIIVATGDREEIILQLISSQDSRIIWWQAVEVRSGKPSSDEQRALLTKILAPLMDHLARKEKPTQTSQENVLSKKSPGASLSESMSETDSSTRPDSQQGNGPKQRPDRKTEKKHRGPKPDDVSPM